MKIKVSSGFTGVVATGSYENARPNFSAEVEFEVKDDSNIAEIVATLQAQLHEISYGKFKSVEQNMIVERIQKERKDIRFYEKDGIKYPSVTSIINYDSDFFVNDEELMQYASQGTITHARVAEFIKSGKWVEPKLLPEVWTDIVILTKGNLQLPLEVGDFPGFLKKYPIKEMKNSEVVFNEEHGYAGTPDFSGIPLFKDAKEIDTLWDVKRNIDKVKVLMQLSAYAKCSGHKQIGAIALNDKTEQGFSKPLIEDRIDDYFGMFLKKKDGFKRRYGI